MKNSPKNKISRELLFLIICLQWMPAAFAQPAIIWLESLENVHFPFHILGGSEGPAVSDDGRVVVGSTKRAQEDIHSHEMEAFIAFHGVKLGLGLPSPRYYGIRDIIVCGNGDLVFGQFYGAGDQTFSWSLENGYQLTSLKVIACSSDGRIAVGQRHGKTVRIAADGSELVISDLIPLSYHSTTVTGMSSDGSVVVGTLRNEDYGVIGSYMWSEKSGLKMINLFAPETTEILGISGDGRTVFGVSSPANRSSYSRTGFVWNQIDPAVKFTRTAAQQEYIPSHISYDGSTLVGWRATERNFLFSRDTFVWTSNSGVQLLDDFLRQQYSFATNGQKLVGAAGISANGKVIAGAQLNRGSYEDFQGWIVYLDSERTELSISAELPHGILPGDESYLDLVVSNMHWQDADDVWLIAQLPAFLQAKDVVSNNATCRLIHHGIECKTRTLQSGKDYQVRIRTKALAPGNGQLQVVASSRQIDEDNTNNRLNLKLEVQGSPSQLDLRLPDTHGRYNDRAMTRFLADAWSFSGRDLSNSIQWEIVGETGEVIQRRGRDFSLILAPGPYVVVATVVDEAGITVHSNRQHIFVERILDIQAKVSKQVKGLLFWKEEKTVLEWSGAAGNVDIYQERSCDVGPWWWSKEEQCLPMKKVATAGRQGRMEFEYKRYDAFLVCEEGTDISKQGFEGKCSARVQQEN